MTSPMRRQEALALAVLVGTLLVAMASHLISLDGQGEQSGLVINEVLASNRQGLLDDESHSSDWVELKNVSERPLDLAGFSLSHTMQEPGAWKIPSHVLEPGEIQLIRLSGEGRSELRSRARPWLDEELEVDDFLIHADDEWSYTQGPDPAPRGWFSRGFDDREYPRGQPGFGDGEEGVRTRISSSSQLLYVRRRFHVEDPEALARLVLRVDYNAGFVAFLNGHRVASHMQLTGFGETVIKPHAAGIRETYDLGDSREHLVAGENVLALGVASMHRSSRIYVAPELGIAAPVLHADLTLSRRGDRLVLWSPELQVVDAVSFSRQRPDQSFGRSDALGGGWAHFLTPTPGRPNDMPPHALPSRVRLSFNPEPGVHPGPVEIRLDVEGPGDLIPRYTLDGSEPTAADPVLSDAHRIGSSTVLRVAVFRGKERVGSSRVAHYLIQEARGIPVLALTVSPDSLDEVHGKVARRGRVSEQAAVVELFAAGGERLAEERCGIRLHGGGGRSDRSTIKRSYKLSFRERFGRGRLRADAIPGSGIRDFDKLVLRAGYNDRYRPGRGGYNLRAAYLRDELLRRLHAEMGGMQVHGAWYQVVINGEDRGLYNVVERVDERYARAHSGRQGWDVVKTWNRTVSGSSEDWLLLWEFAKRADLSGDDEYRQVSRGVDLEDFCTYMVLNFWAQNVDWPHTNWVVARPSSAGGKWRFLLWDVETSLGLRDPDPASDPLARMRTQRGQNPQDNPIADLFDGLFTNAEFRALFKKTARRHLSNELQPDRVLALLDEQRRVLEPVMGKELETFAPAQDLADWQANLDFIEDYVRARHESFAQFIEAL